MIEPIRRSVTVDCSPEHAFRVFTKELDTWWPLHTHAIADQETGLEVVRVEFQEHVGGHVIEHASDGSWASWAEVLVWDPPVRFVLAWKPNDRPVPPTEVDVRFVAEGNGTRVDLEHRGWERLGELAAEGRADYASEGGWVLVLGRFVAAANAEAARG